MRHKHVPDAQGGLPGHPELAFHVGRKVLAEERGIPLRAGSPLSKPESTSFPCTVLPKTPCPEGDTCTGHPSSRPHLTQPQADQLRLGPSPGLGHQGPLPLHRRLEASWQADPIPGGLSYACRISLPSPCPYDHTLAFFLPSTRCWYRSGGEGAGSGGWSSGC